MRLKLAEHSRLLSLAVEAEGLADAETLKAAEVEAALERRLEEVAATEQALTEVREEGELIRQWGGRGRFVKHMTVILEWSLTSSLLSIL